MVDRAAPEAAFFCPQNASAGVGTEAFSYVKALANGGSAHACDEARSMLEQSRYAMGGVLGWIAPSDRRWVGYWVRLLDRVLHTNKTDEELP
jgi:hypothetical protein